MSRMFANGPGDSGSIPSRIISKTQKMVLNAALLNTRHYKWNNRGYGVASPLHLCVIANEKGAFGSPSTKVASFIFTLFWR